MAILTKLTIGLLTLIIGTAITAHQLTNNNYVSEQPAITKKIDLEITQEELEPDPIEQTSEDDSDTKETKSQRPREGSTIDKSTFFFRPNHTVEKQPIKFQPIEGKKRPTWLDQLNNTKGSCQDNNTCEWSALLKAHVPANKKDFLEKSAIAHAYKKCEEIKGVISNSNERYPTGWKSCTYSDLSRTEEATFYELNLDNQDLYE
ncbi:hypothetical protein [Candidatus Mycoplasma haematohominis]|uniref:hypothetical protein n=1 Tax=Candidatus Mycoplasma haematohominis TaxID=1494318 RepID=UPI001C0A746F|nr:hypothetical protein [Candidatus Mycoplasma haemohominis]